VVVATIGVAVVAEAMVGPRVHGGHHGVVGQGVGDEGAVVGVGGGHAGVVVGVGIGLGISFSLGLTLLTAQVDEGGDLVDGTMAQGDRGGDRGGVVDKGGGVVDKGSMVEEGVGDDLVGHLGGHLDHRLDERGVGDGVGHGEDGGGGDHGDWGSDGQGGNRVCKGGGGVDGVVRGKDWGGGGEGEGEGVGGVGEQDGGVGFRPCQAERGNGENSKRAHHAVCWSVV